MIKGYDIKYINNEEILYIYLDFNSEFASLNKKNSNNKIKDEIKSYIKTNKINFKGLSVAIIVGGVMMGTIFLNEDINKTKNILTNSSSKIVSIIDNNIYINEFSKESIDDTSINIKIEEEKETENNIENQNLKKSIKKENINEEVIIDKKDINNKLLYVNLKRSNGVVLIIELEKYLIGVVGAEMPASFNIEALKAQAVVARTYTLKTLKNNKILTDSSNTQNYKSDSELKILWGSNYYKYYNKIKNAVNSTKGIFLTYNDEYIDAVYHSTSNGLTENSEYVWSDSKPYLISVKSEYDITNKSFLKNIYLSYEDISNKLGILINENTKFNILSKTESGRIKEIEINGNTYSGVDFRNLLDLRSTDFEIENMDDGISITTKGYGHGVGMSQYGANGMANNGVNYIDILKHYYSGIKVNYS